MKLNVLTVFGGLYLALSTICVLYFAGKKFFLSHNKMTFWPLVTFSKFIIQNSKTVFKNSIKLIGSRSGLFLKLISR